MNRLEKLISENKVIGRRRYVILKSRLMELDQTNTDELIKFRELNKVSVADAERMVSDYEKKNKTFSNKKTIEYFSRLNEKKEVTKKELTKEWLWNEFLKAFYLNEKTKFVKNSETLENIKPIFFYFLQDFKEFKKCKRLTRLSEPDLSKGLLIVGGYGNGKSSIMRAFETVFKYTNLIFKGYSTNDAVTMYDACNNSIEKDELMKALTTGTRYFDDVKTERMASNYGKVELFKDVFEIRNRNKLRTYLTMNYRDGSTDVNDGLLEIAEKYGNRVYDRIFEDYNIIEFKGKSFRK